MKTETKTWRHFIKHSTEGLDGKPTSTNEKWKKKKHFKSFLTEWKTNTKSENGWAMASTVPNDICFETVNIILHLFVAYFAVVFFFFCSVRQVCECAASVASNVSFKIRCAIYIFDYVGNTPNLKWTLPVSFIDPVQHRHHHHRRQRRVDSECECSFFLFSLVTRFPIAKSIFRYFRVRQISIFLLFFWCCRNAIRIRSYYTICVYGNAVQWNALLPSDETWINMRQKRQRQKLLLVSIVLILYDNLLSQQKRRKNHGNDRKQSQSALKLRTRSA